MISANRPRVSVLNPPQPVATTDHAGAGAPVALSLKLNNDLIQHFKYCLAKNLSPKLVVKDGNYSIKISEDLVFPCTQIPENLKFDVYAAAPSGASNAYAFEGTVNHRLNVLSDQKQVKEYLKYLSQNKSSPAAPTAPVPASANASPSPGPSIASPASSSLSLHHNPYKVSSRDMANTILQKFLCLVALGPISLSAISSILSNVDESHLNNLVQQYTQAYDPNDSFISDDVFPNIENYDASFDNSSGTKLILKDKAYKELKPWGWHWYNQHERGLVINNINNALTRLGFSDTHPLRRKIVNPPPTDPFNSTPRPSPPPSASQSESQTQSESHSQSHLHLQSHSQPPSTPLSSSSSLPADHAGRKSNLGGGFITSTSNNKKSQAKRSHTESPKPSRPELEKKTQLTSPLHKVSSPTTKLPSPPYPANLASQSSPQPTKLSKVSNKRRYLPVSSSSSASSSSSSDDDNDHDGDRKRRKRAATDSKPQQQHQQAGSSNNSDALTSPSSLNDENSSNDEQNQQSGAKKPKGNARVVSHGRTPSLPPPPPAASAEKKLQYYTDLATKFKLKYNEYEALYTSLIKSPSSNIRDNKDKKRSLIKLFELHSKLSEWKRKLWDYDHEYKLKEDIMTLSKHKKNHTANKPSSILRQKAASMSPAVGNGAATRGAMASPMISAATTNNTPTVNSTSRFGGRVPKLSLDY